MSTPRPTTAQVHRVCCDWKSGVARPSPRRAYWELYVVVYGTTDPWPSYRWPVARRHDVPTVQERADALARLGYQPASGAVWEWQELECPSSHGHRAGLSFLGSIQIIPIERPGRPS